MNILSKLFRRKPVISPAEPPPTAEQGRAILLKAVEQTLKNGLEGYVVAGLTKDAINAEGIVCVSGSGLKEHLSKMLVSLLAQSQYRDDVVGAIVAALSQSGIRIVQFAAGDGDCLCSVCTARREREASQPTTH